MTQYYLMSQDTPLFSFTLNTSPKLIIHSIDTVYNTNLLPEMLKSPNPDIFISWLEQRQIDADRPNAKLLLDHLNLPQSTLEPILYNKALNLTDSYWIKSVTSQETYNSVNFTKSSYDPQITTLTLTGVLSTDNPSTQSLPQLTPELTNIGSFEKAWIYEKDTWFLYKSGTKLNQYAEMMTYNLGKLMGMKMAKYDYINPFVKSQLFTSANTQLELYSSFKYRFSNRDYNDITCYNNLKSISQSIANEYLDILLLDGIVCNPDRHEENWGVLKEVSTGKIISLAPNYDNNLAFNAALDNSFSHFLLKSHLHTFGIQPHQIPYLNKLTKSAIQSLHNKLVIELSLNPNKMDFYLQNLHESIDYITSNL